MDGCSAHELCQVVLALFSEPPTLACPALTVTLLILPPAAVTRTPLLGLTCCAPFPGLIDSPMLAAAAEDWLAEAGAVRDVPPALGVPDDAPPEQAPRIRQAAAETAASPASLEGRAARRERAVAPRSRAAASSRVSARSLCRTVGPPVADRLPPRRAFRGAVVPFEPPPSRAAPSRSPGRAAPPAMSPARQRRGGIPGGLGSLRGDLLAAGRHFHY